MDNLHQPEGQVVAVTGGIGSGKSTVSSILEQLGATVVSADGLAREVVSPGSAANRAVASAFGEGVLAADGSIDRKALGRIVFSDSAKLRQLEAIMHPAIRALASERFASAIKAGAPLIVYDCPLLFEAGLDSLPFRAIVTVVSSKSTCISRVMRRDGLSAEDAELRIAAQLPLEEKARRSTHVLNNEGTLEELTASVKKLFSEFCPANRS